MSTVGVVATRKIFHTFRGCKLNVLGAREWLGMRGCELIFTFLELYPAFLPPPGISSINFTQQLFLFNRKSSQDSKMSQNSFNNNTNCQNTTNSYNTVSNYYTVGDDLSPLLTWLSPLDPGLRHCDIQERRVANIGECLMETDEFRRWCRLDGGGENDKAVLFCYGNPGVGKTFIR